MNNFITMNSYHSKLVCLYKVLLKNLPLTLEIISTGNTDCISLRIAF